MMSLTHQLRNLPKTPGVYLFKNPQGNVLYVGKAKALHHRVPTYFRSQGELSPAKQIMVQQIANIDWVETTTEADALVLEDQLIKDYQPRFNILAKDDKSFLYIHITAEDFPRVVAVRRPDLGQGGSFYGPYPYAHSIRQVLKLVHRIFPYRTCSTLPRKACLEYYLGNCRAPCIGKISVTDYRALIQQVIALFEGDDSTLTEQLQAEMQQAAAQQQFEQAARRRDQLAALKQLRAWQTTHRQQLLGRYHTSQLDPAQGLAELQRALQLACLPQRIEIYDISHQHGQYTVGALVVFTAGVPDKAEYRRFRIKTVRGINDFASLQEVIQRRLRRPWPLPDLAIMDGGKGQLSAVAALWHQAQVPVMALAKRREEVFKTGVRLPLVLPLGSQGLFLLQRMRDEAHRFAIQYYRLLHKKSLLGRQLSGGELTGF